MNIYVLLKKRLIQRKKLLFKMEELKMTVQNSSLTLTMNMQ